MAFLALMGVLSVITMRGEMSETTAMSVIVALGLTDGEQKLIETVEQVVMEAVRVMAPCIERTLAGMGVVGDEAALIQQRLGEATVDVAKAKVVFSAATAPLTQQELLYWKDGAATCMSAARLERVLVALGVPNAKLEQQLAGRYCASEPPAAAATGAAGEAKAPPAWFRHERQLRSSLAGEDEEFKEAATAAAAAAAEAGAGSAASPAWFRHEHHLRSSLAGENETEETDKAAAAAAAAVAAAAAAVAAAATSGVGADLPPPRRCTSPEPVADRDPPSALRHQRPYSGLTILV